jgi:hypothetical protein
MSLNKTLDRFFDEIRREARRNQAFADRLDVVLRAHVSRRDLVEGEGETEADGTEAGADEVNGAPASLALNPVGLMQREGEDALAAALAAADRASLIALIEEHNLDPSGEAGGLDREALAAHVLAHARRRAERDKKLFDY